MFPYFELFGRTFGTYGVCMVIGVLLVCVLTIRKGRKYHITVEDVVVLAATTVGVGVLCGGLLYLLVTYSLEEIIAFILAGDFSMLFSGIVFYGGLIGGILGACLGVRLTGCNFSHMARSAVPFIPMGHAVGRVGCLMAGCCYGMPYDGPFAVHYHNSLYGLSPEQGYFPSQLAEAVLNVCIGFCLLRLEKRAKLPVDLLFAYLGLYGIVRFVLEFFRGDAIRGVYEGLSTSQWISVGMMAACLVFLAAHRKILEMYKKSHPAEICE